MAAKQSTAFITARKGFCYLTVKIGRENFHLRRIRNYTLAAEDKRNLRRRNPDIDFDWKKIDKQLAEKREACRRYRSRRRSSATARRSRDRQPGNSYALYDPIRRSVYADEPCNAADAGALLDAVLCIDRPLGLPLLPPAAPRPAPMNLLRHTLPRRPQTLEIIASKQMQCQQCDAFVAMLIFAPDATDIGHFEDYARTMYSQYTRLNLPTWIIGPALGDGPLMDRLADILKVWPTRAPMQRLRPAEFNPILDRLAEEHCKPPRRSVGHRPA